MLVQSSSSSSLFVVDVASRTQKIHSRRTSAECLHHCAGSRRRRDTSTIGISISFRSALRSDRGKIEKTQSHNGREYFDRMHAERSDTHFSFNNPSYRFDPLSQRRACSRASRSASRSSWAAPATSPVWPESYPCRTAWPAAYASSWPTSTSTSSRCCRTATSRRASMSVSMR